MQDLMCNLKNYLDWSIRFKKYANAKFFTKTSDKNILSKSIKVFLYKNISQFFSR